MIWEKFLIVLVVLIVSQRQMLYKAIRTIQNVHVKIALVGNIVFVDLVQKNLEQKSLNSGKLLMNSKKVNS